MVDFLYFIWGIISVALALNVLFPIRLGKRGELPFISYVLGWIIGDLAPHWLLLNLGGFFLYLALLPEQASVALLPFFLHWLGVAMVLVRWLFMFRLHDLVHLQMQSALGADYEQQIAYAKRKKISPVKFDWKAYWNPNRLLRSELFTIKKNLVFAEVDGISLKLDLYLPIQDSPLKPVLLEIHGGGWTIGTKNQALPLMARMASQGWVCATITYRKSPRGVFPDHLVDCKRAMAWLKENADEFGLDPKKFFITGGSAGGHLAALMALTANKPHFQPGFEAVDTRVLGCVAFYGIYDFLAPFGIDHPNRAMAHVLKLVMRGTPATKQSEFLQASPIHSIHAAAPPIMLLQGESDALVTQHEAQRFYHALQEHGVSQCVYLRLPFIEHAFDMFPAITTIQVLPAVEKFLALLLTQYEASQT